MAKFVREKRKDMPSISTVSLLVIVLTLLFFYMVTFQLRETKLGVTYKLISAASAKKLENKSLIRTIYIGPPTKKLQTLYGTKPLIQLEGQFTTNIEDIKTFISNEREQISESEQAKMTISLKIDENTPMGLVSEVKKILRESNALKINYSTNKGKRKEISSR